MASLQKSYRRHSLTMLLVIVLGLFMNIVPLWQEPITAHADAPTTDYFVYVNTNTYDGGLFLGTGIGNCVAHFTDTTSFPPPAPILGPNECNLGQAINLINNFDLNFSHNLSVAIRFAENIDTINITRNLPPITFPGQVVIDGQRTAAPHKVALRDDTRSADNPTIPVSNTLDYFFRVATTNSLFGDQELTITNFAFTALKKNTAVAITTDDISTTIPPASNQTTIKENLEGANIRQLTITNNYFGTTNGVTLDVNNFVFGGIQLSIYESGDTQPTVLISDNNFYNTSVPIFVGAGTIAQPFVSIPPKTCQYPQESTITIRDNLIGLSSTKTISTSTDGTNGGWVTNAIEVCNFSGVHIANNIITNTNKAVLVQLLTPVANAVLVTRSNGKITDNYIGLSDTAIANELTEIKGNGIVIQDNYSHTTEIDNEMYITGNRIFNLTTKLATYCSLHVGSARYTPVTEQSSVCGGTGILIEGSNDNWIYNNTIGSRSAPNQGYGIAIEGTFQRTVDDTFITVPSFNNKINGNIISYNHADGVHVGTVTSSNDTTAESGLPCISSGTTQSNNCANSISHNSIYRNGLSNSAATGGIGIDLKGPADTEQKNAALDSSNQTGTNNDTDLSLVTTTRNGGNGLISAPSLYGPGSSTAQRSSANEIRGFLPSNTATGRYWIEVFQVGCPAESSSSLPIGTLAQATSNCDTDSPSSAEQTANRSYGQGKDFLCGTFINVTGGNVTNWQCNPETFGNSAATGLITATLSVHEPPTTISRSYESIILATPTSFPSAANDVGLSTRRYTCALAQTVISAVGPCTGQTASNAPALDARANVYIASFMGNTSEFSGNVFIEPPVVPTFTVSKTVMACLSVVICEDTFAESAASQPGQFVDFRIVVTNTSTSSPVDIQITDTLPTGLTLQDGSCIYQQDFTQALPVRTNITTESHDCSGAPIAISMTGLQPGKTGAVFFQAHISPTLAATAINNTAIATSGSISHESSATITLTAINVPPAPPPEATTVLTLNKSITTADHVGNPANGTIVSSSSAQTVSYRILATATGYDSTTIANLTLQDNFPRAVGTQNISYATCRILITIGPLEGPPGDGNCQNSSSINGTAETPITIFTGSQVLSIAEGGIVNTSDTVEVAVTYTATIPANTLNSGATAVALNNIARWGENAVAIGDRQRSSTTLTIQAPGSTPPVATSPTLTKLVRTCTSTTATSCQSSSFVSSLSTIAVGSTVEYRLEINNASTNVANVTIQDIQPNNIVFSQTATGCQFINNASAALTLTGARPVGVSSCQFTGNNVNIATSIASTHRGYVFLLAQVATGAASTTITNQAQLSAGCTTNCSSSAIIGVTASTTPPSTPPTSPSTPATSTAAPVVTLIKRADNAVTTTDRSLEKIYKPGDTVNYTLTLTNTGGPATGISIQDRFSDALNSVATDSLTTGVTQGIAQSVLTLGSIAVHSGTPVSLRYHGTILAKSAFDLDTFDLDKSTDPKKDDDLYLAKDTDIVDQDISSASNSHRRASDLFGAPDGKFVSLGQDGSLTLDLGTKLVVDGTGDDFALLQLDTITDDTDQTNEALTVEVSQNGTTFKKLPPRSSEEHRYDLSKIKMSWIRFIKFTDDSSATKAKAPGVDLDAMCFLHLGVELPNRATMTVGTQSSFANAPIVVDVSKVFKESPDAENCNNTNVEIATQPTPAIVAPPAPPSTPRSIPTTTSKPPLPPTLVKSGTIGIMGITTLTVLGCMLMRKKRNRKKL